MHNTSDIAPDVNSSVEDYYDYLGEWEGVAHIRSLNYATMVVLGLVVIVGGFCNISTVVVLIRRRLWVQNEGYIHLLAILVGNIVIIVIVTFPHWMSLFRDSYHVGLTSNAACKVWHFLAYVVFSTGWYVVALLLGVFWRDRLTRGVEFRCVRRLTVKYCTLLGSKVVVGVISGAFAVMNLWHLWSVELIEFSVGGEDYGKLCEVAHDWYSHFYMWEYVSLGIIWYLPVLVIVPLLLVAILWTRRSTAFAGFSFRRMNDDESDSDDGGFGRAALLIGLTVFLLQSPIIIIYICLTVDYHENLTVAYGVAHILATTHLVVVPVLCLATVARMREEIRSAAAAGKCCPGRDSDEDGDENGILQLDALAQQSSNKNLV